MPPMKPGPSRPVVFNPHGVLPPKGGQQEPTVQFGQSTKTDYDAIGEFLTCSTTGGRKARRGGVNEKRPSDSPLGPPVKRTKTESGTNDFGSVTNIPPLIPPGPPSQTKPPLPPITAVTVQKPTDPNLATIVSGMKQIDTGLRNTAAEYVKNNFWTITGTTAAATGLATCFGPGAALIPIICTAIASYSPTLAAFIQSPEAKTVSDMKRAIQESKSKDRQRIQDLINTASKDQKQKYEKLKGALDRLSNIAANVPDVPTSSDKIVEVIENINTEVKELPKSEEVKDAVPTDKQIEDATKPTGGSRRRRLSAPTRKVKRSSSSKPKRYTRRRRE